MSIIDLVLGLFLSWLVSRATGLPMVPWSIGAVALIYLLVIRRSGSGNVVGALTNAVGRTVDFFERIIMGTVIFIVAFMILYRITGVPPEYATEGFRVLGVRPWGWPAHIGLPLLVFAITTLYACHLAIDSVHGKTRMVTILFLGVLMAYLLPGTFSVALPSDGKKPSANPVDGATTDNGLIGVAGKAVVVVPFGETTSADGTIEEDGNLGVWSNKLRRWAIGKPKPAMPPQAHYTAPAPTRIVKVGKERHQYTFPADGCVSVYLHGNWESYPIGGKISFRSQSSGEVVLYDDPKKQSHSSLPSGNYQICKVDPEAWRVDIFQ